MTDELPELAAEQPELTAEATEPSEPTWQLVPASGEALDAAAQAVKAGACIVLPTDTVYGIGADAFSSEAVQRLLDAKRRGRDMPPPVLIAEPGMLRALAADPPTAAVDLAKRFWPGALTLIVKAHHTLHLEIGDTDGTVAVRVPDHDVARSLLRHTGPLAVSSANVSGEPPATTATAAIEQLGNAVSVYVDAGESPGGVASTIIDFTADDAGRIVRQGAIAFDDLVAVAPGLRPLDEPAASDPVEPEPSPGVEDGQES